MKKVVKGWIGVSKTTDFSDEVYLHRTRRVADCVYGKKNVYRCTITYTIPRRKKK